MTQPSLLDAPGEVRYLDRLAAFFRQHPGEWIDGMVIAQTSGCYAWRTRISECRTLLGLTIENRQRRIGRRRISEYRYSVGPRTHANSG